MPTSVEAHRDAPVSSMQVYLTALACAFAIATLYNNQPLVPLISKSFGTADHVTGLVVTLSQAGYAAGLFLFVPIADRVDRRRLIVSMLLCNAVCLAVCAGAPNFYVFALSTFIAGLTTVTPQIIIPTVAGAMPPQLRGRTVGILLSGMAAGLLLGRTASGIVADIAGWRAVFLGSTGLNAIIVLIVWRFLPDTRPATSLSYVKLLGSLPSLFMEYAVLRSACVTGFLAFGAASTIWATLAVLLAQSPYHLGARAAGLFGLVGIASIVSAPLIGRLTDRHGSKNIIALGFITLMVSSGILAQAEHGLLLIVIAIVLIDLGYRSVLIPNQTRIYALQADAHGRLNTVYMTSVFLGGALGSTFGGIASAYASWSGVAAACAVLAALGMIFHVTASSRNACVRN